MIRYSPQTTQILDVVKDLYNESFNISPEIALTEHILQCIRALDEVGDNHTTGDGSLISVDRKPLLSSIFLPPVGKLLKEAFLDNSPIFQLLPNSSQSRVVISTQILENFPRFIHNRLTLDHIPIMHYAAYKCRSLRLVELLHQAIPAAIQAKDDKGALPLHWASLCSTEKTGDLSPTSHSFSSSIFSFLLQSFPAAAQVRDRDGQLPLHWAVNQDTHSLDVISSLLDAYSEASFVPSNEGLLPLHQLVRRSAPSVDALEQLIVRCPASTSTPCHSGWLPIHYLVNRSDVSLSALRILLEHSPDTLTHRTKAGQLPLHRLLQRHKPCRKAVRVCVEAAPSSLRVADADGFLPLHILLDSFSPPSISMVQMLIQNNLPTVREKTLDGYLPLHFAMRMFEEHEKLETSTLETTDNYPLSLLPPSSPPRSPSPLLRSFTRDSPAQAQTIPNTVRCIAIIKELLAAYPEAAYEYVVDIVPSESGVDAEGWDGGWRKVRWCPMSLALNKGTRSSIAKIFRPYRRKQIASEGVERSIDKCQYQGASPNSSPPRQPSLCPPDPLLNVPVFSTMAAKPIGRAKTRETLVLNESESMGKEELV
jgi:ankyrin repeat protein